MDITIGYSINARLKVKDNKHVISFKMHKLKKTSELLFGLDVNKHKLKPKQNENYK